MSKRRQSQADRPQRASSSVPATKSIPVDTTCRVCGCSETHRVSAIVQAAQWHAQHAQRTPQAPGEQALPLGPYALGVLSAKLVPPPPPAMKRLPTETILCIPCLSMLFFGVGWVANADSANSIIGYLCALLAAISGLAIRFVYMWLQRERNEAKRQYIAAVSRHRRAMQTWDRLVYCKRCDSVIDPQTGKSALAAQMRKLLSSAGS